MVGKSKALVATLVLVTAFGALGLSTVGAAKAERYILGLFDTSDVVSHDWIEAAGATIVRIPPNADFVVVLATQEAASDLAADPRTRYLEVDGVVQLEDTPNDLSWGNQWGPPAINAPAAWDVVSGNNAVVYGVVDTGVEYTHPDLVANMWINDDLPNLLDDDGNGYVDDTFGWDCATNDRDPKDANGHGTHVAGIAAAVKNNVFGIAGMAQIKIMALKIFDGSSFNSAAAECIRYGADNGARVVGMSWFTSASTAINDAITYAWSKNVVLMKSAGNQNGGQVTYPGTLPEVIAVSALANPTTLATYSSQGTKVEVSAPGSSIFSTYLNNQFATLSGTSMAQPHASGVALLTISKNTGLTNQQVRNILTSTADDLGAPGKDNLYGWGRVDALGAVQAA